MSQRRSLVARPSSLAPLLLMALPFALCALHGEEGEDELALWVNEGKWAHGPHAVETTPERQSKKAKRLESIGDVRQAAESYRRMADEFSESDLAEEGLVLSARNYLKAGDFTKCRAQLDELHRRYVNPAYLDAIGETEIALARGFLEGKGEGGTYMFSSRLRKSKAIFQKQLDGDPQGRWAPHSMYGLGNCAEALHDYDGAIKTYKQLLDKYPRTELRAEVESHIALCISLRHPLPSYSEADTEEARRRIANAKDESNADIQDLDKAALDDNERILTERMAQKRYDSAMFYKKNGKYRAAEVYFEIVLERYGKSKVAPKAKQELEDMRKHGGEKQGLIDETFDRIFKR